jgi:hypothetical protein
MVGLMRVTGQCILTTYYPPRLSSSVGKNLLLAILLRSASCRLTADRGGRRPCR